jgi:hypothetical protein
MRTAETAPDQCREGADQSPIFAIRPPTRDQAWTPTEPRRGWACRVLFGAGVLLLAASVPALVGGLDWRRILDVQLRDLTGTGTLDVAVDRIIDAESRGDPNARNKRSSATGAAQFLDQTWIEMIRAHRPDLVNRSQEEILDLRRDLALAREITMRFAERNASTLRARCLPVTLGTLYLSHFAGGAGAVAILSAAEHADAAAIMAGADVTGRTTREKIVKANPFIAGFTAGDLKRWADRKMGGPVLAEWLPANTGSAISGAVLFLTGSTVAAGQCRPQIKKT